MPKKSKAIWQPKEMCVIYSFTCSRIEKALDNNKDSWWQYGKSEML